MKFGVVGDPVLHSRSPAIHNAGFVALGIDATYEPIPTPSDSFPDVVARLRDGSLAGVNVTMPHKKHAFEACDSRSEIAEMTGAVNTIIARNGQLRGTNTDIGGVQRCLSLVEASEDVPLLVLGAGGAAAATVVAGADHPVVVSSRNTRRAEELLSRTGVDGRVIQWGEAVAGAVVINTTPLGMRREILPNEPLTAASALVDMTYGSHESPAVAFVRNRGMPVADGIDMLVGQAIEAFTIFTGQAAPVDVLDAAARAEQ